jgi:hypothetical protein
MRIIKTSGKYQENGEHMNFCSHAPPVQLRIRKLYLNSASRAREVEKNSLRNPEQV